MEVSCANPQVDKDLRFQMLKSYFSVYFQASYEMYKNFLPMKIKFVVTSVTLHSLHLRFEVSK